MGDICFAVILRWCIAGRLAAINILGKVEIFFHGQMGKLYFSHLTIKDYVAMSLQGLYTALVTPFVHEAVEFGDLAKFNEMTR
jgi:hypothetical protein